MSCQNEAVETQYLGELPVDTLASLPDYFLAERDVLDKATGDIVRSIVRVPTAKIFPHANMDNVFALEMNNTAMTVPEKQVRAVYIRNAGNAYIMDYANAQHKPFVLAIGRLNDDLMLCQNAGVVNIPEGHDYVIGQQYYVGENGEPVTDNTSGYKLFIPINGTQLAINLYGA